MGIRVIKTALAASLAVYFAYLLGLHFYASAGILAILSVEITRKRNLYSAGQRMLASLVGLALAALLFETLGFHVWTLGLYIVLSFPLLAAIHLRDGIVTGAVIVFHLFEAGSVNWHSLLNELLLLLVGIGTATMINLVYMPRQDRELIKRKMQLEGDFAEIFRQIGTYLRDASSDWSGAEVLQVEKTIKESVELALRNMENGLFGSEQSNWFNYFKMREEQLESLRQMLLLTAQLTGAVPQGERLSAVFFAIGDDLKEDHYTGNTEKQLDALEAHFKTMPLPQQRDEFENRSALLQVMFEMRRYLAIARNRK